jgi:hypothetical protein
MNPRFGICITTCDRIDYWRRSAASLRKTDVLVGTKIIISDDFSLDPDVRLTSDSLVGNWNEVEVINIHRKARLGSASNYRETLSLFDPKEFDVIINLDSDALYNRLWMRELDGLMSKYNYDVIANVFFCDDSPIYPWNFVKDAGDHFERSALHGLGLSFPSRFLTEICPQVTEANHFDHCLCNYARAKQMKFACPKKSYIEHIGDHGVNSHSRITFGTNFIGE